MKTKPLTLAEGDPIRVPRKQGKMLLDPEADAVRATRDGLSEALASAKPGTVVPLDLTGMGMSASCLAALLGPVLESMTDGAYEDRYVVGVDPQAKNRWDADAALAKEARRTGKKLVCVWRTSEGSELVGDVDERVRATYRFVLDHAERGTTARSLADQEELSIQAASNRLLKAQRLGIIHRASRRPVSGSGGSESVYIAVT